MKTLIAAVLAASIMLPGVVTARTVDAPQFATRVRQFQPVEQQNNIANRTGCVWDLDDTWEIQAVGIWRAGTSSSYTMCVVGDWASHLWVIDTTDARLKVNVTATGGPSGKCLLGPKYDHSANLPVVGDGVGVIWNITFTVRNDTTGRVGTNGHPVFVTAAAYPNYSYSNGGILTSPYLRNSCPGAYPYWGFTNHSGTYPGPYWDW